MRNIINACRSVTRRTLALTAIAACMLASILGLRLSVVPRAHAATGTTIGVISCNPCATISDLQTAAYNWANANNVAPHVILVTSLNAPVSGFFQFVCKARGCNYVPKSPTTTDNMSGAALDNQGYSRASKLAPVSTPANITYNDTDEIIIQYIQSQIVATGQFGIGWWHSFPNFGPTPYYTMHDLQTGQTENVYVGDAITVSYPGGYSEKWEFLGVHTGVSVQWQRVLNTLMLNGKPVTPPTGVPGTPVTGNLNTQEPYNPGTIDTNLSPNLCYGVDSVCIEVNPDEPVCDSGFFTFPC